MQSFFVLGQIPGTEIIITFTMWMQFAAAVLAVGILFYVRRSQTVKDILTNSNDVDATAQ